MTIYLIFLVALCNVTCLRASRVIVSLFALDLGAPQFWVGVLIATYALFPALLALYAGKLSDRLGPRLPMVVGSCGLIAGLLLPAAIPRLPALYVSAALFGLSYVFYHVSVQNLLGALTAGDSRTRVFSNYSLMIAIGGFIGPLCAGFLIDQAGWRWAYLSLAAVAVVPVVTQLVSSKLREASRPQPKSGSQQDRKEDAQSLFANASLRSTLITSGMVLTGTDLFQFYMPIYGHSIGLSASAIGTILSMVAAAAFLVRVVLPAMVRKAGEVELLTWSLFLGGATYLLFPLLHDTTWLALAGFMLGIALGCGQPLSMMLTYAHSPQGRSGEALGLRLTINNFTHIAVPVVFGSIGSAFGVAPVFWVNALMLAGGGALNRSARG